MFEGLTYQFVYNLERHRFFNVRLRRWLILLCLILPAATWFGAWGTGRATAVVLTLGAAVTLVAVWRAGRQRYVRFAAYSRHTHSGEPPKFSEEAGGMEDETNHQPLDPFPIESPLPTMSKVRVRATGFFEVSGMRRYFVETPADYTTFETREHCVMARAPLTRFLLLGTSNRYEAGWWYTFFQPWMIRSVTCGLLYFGLRPRLALQLQITADNEGEVLYLSFDDEVTRSMVLADLRHDAAL